MLTHYAAGQDGQSEYRLGPGDNIRIMVFQNPDLTLETRVTENGTITYPLIGAVRIGGMTIGVAERVIAKALSDGAFVKNPQVTIIATQMRNNHVSILGLVNKPGRYAIDTVNVRVSEMLALAGGIAGGGSDVVVLTGTRDGKPYHREIEMAGVLLENRPQEDVAVAGGDVLYVHRAPTYYIYGEVQKPGAYRVERGMNVRQALVQAGGPTVHGSERSLRLYRGGSRGATEPQSPELGDLVQPDDVYFVRQGIF